MKGQSLLEVLVSLSLGTIFLTSSVVLLSIVLKAQTNLNFQSEFYSLAKDYSNLIFYSSKNQWSSLYTLDRNSPYKISFVENAFSYSSGMEESQIKNTPYHLYFKVFDVYRDINGNISETGDLDPSTLKIVIYFDYGPEHQTSFNFSFYVTRSYLNEVFTQTDWSGGEGYSGPYFGAGNVYDTSENVEAGAYE